MTERERTGKKGDIGNKKDYNEKLISSSDGLLGKAILRSLNSLSVFVKFG